MAELRANGPYVWVTWLTKLLVGENSCEWAVWFKAQHEGWSWNRIPTTYDHATWQIGHTARVSECRQRWEEQGHAVFTESQNSFVLYGRSAALGGRPDLIAWKGNSGTVIDIKTGQPSPSHSVQVMLYMYAIPKALGQYSGVTFTGRVSYPDHDIDIPSSAIDDSFVDTLAQLMVRVATVTPARKVPSRAECTFCNITREDCPERTADDDIGKGATEDF